MPDLDDLASQLGIRAAWQPVAAAPTGQEAYTGGAVVAGNTIGGPLSCSGNNPAHEVPAERQFIRHAGIMHLGWIQTGDLRCLLTGSRWSAACGEPGSEAVNHQKRHGGLAIPGYIQAL